ncbi:helix-turn-helix transcriptional regulator [Clostridium intestinale]|uniref:Helix-turn-helix transcriptional regulator n=1 Tax=Clostridium intestinale TaxID=36845 RepID=A0A7D7A1T2_9CLOT|nr:AraC family transcriptional regulator [Clostridium intestinale]QLY78160.1 helix-turn-helix transcriptional regulator [Clostridium intestinale]
MYDKMCTYVEVIDQKNIIKESNIENIFNSDSYDYFYELPKNFGRGYFSSIIPNESMKITICDFTFNENIIFNEIAKVNCLFLSFCVSDFFEWKNVNNKESFILEKDECFIHNSYKFITKSQMNAGERYMGLGMGIDEKRFRNIIDEHFSKEFISDFSVGKLSKISMSLNSKLILKDILNCNYSGSLKTLYIEGKILELLTTTANDLKDNSVIQKIEGHISREDLENITKIKEVIDNNYVEPLTINELSKLAFISQTKLKNNFKKVFGKNIYEYVVDKRMDKARELLDNSKVKVKEAASMVGYSNIGYFSRSFKERYGFSPSEYSKLRTK